MAHGVSYCGSRPAFQWTRNRWWHWNRLRDGHRLREWRGPGSGKRRLHGGWVFSVGGGVSEPVPIYDPDPPYSEQARKAKYQGTVVLMIVVDAQGNVRDVQVVKPLGLGLDEEAVKTVKTWKFKPAQRNGVPVAVRLDVEVTFRLF